MHGKFVHEYADFRTGRLPVVSPNNSRLSTIPRPSNPILKYANCAEQVQTTAKHNSHTLEILGGIGLGDAVAGCGFTGPFVGECEGVVAGLELLYSGVNYATEQTTIWQGETACMQQY
jgi:hypothetical protein